jgi:hypothetical protein
MWGVFVTYRYQLLQREIVHVCHHRCGAACHRRWLCLVWQNGKRARLITGLEPNAAYDDQSWSWHMNADTV